MTVTETRHHPSPPQVTHQPSQHAEMTGVTGESHIQQPLFVTGDRFSEVPPYNARIKRGNTQIRASVTSHPTSGRELPLMPTDRYITERAQLGRCRSCNQPIIRAELHALILATVDPLLLTPLQELEEAIAGRRTYRLKPDQPTLTGERRLDGRYASHMRALPGRGLPTHRCGQVRVGLDLTLLDGTFGPYRPDWVEPTPAATGYRHPEGIPF